MIRQRTCCRRRAVPALLVLVVGAQFAFAPAFAKTPRERVQEGVSEYEAGRFEEALKHFDEAGPVEDEKLRQVILENRAAALFQTGRLADAREAWVQGLAGASAAAEARIRYNIGNCHYQETLAMLKSPAAATDSAGVNGANPIPGTTPVTTLGGAPADGGMTLDAVLQPLDRAIENYRDSVRLDPHFENARANLELALRLKKQLQEQATSQPSSQPSEDSDQQNPNGNQNQNDNSQSENSNSPSSQNSESDDSENSNGEHADQQPQNGNENSDPNEQTNSDQNDSQNGNGSANCNADEQRPDNANNNKNDNGQAERNESQQQNGNDNQPETAATSNPTPVKMTQAEADRLLQIVRDAEMKRREALIRRQQAQRVPVKRDW